MAAAATTTASIVVRPIRADAPAAYEQQLRAAPAAVAMCELARGRRLRLGLTPELAQRSVLIVAHASAAQMLRRLGWGKGSAHVDTSTEEKGRLSRSAQ